MCAIAVTKSSSDLIKRRAPLHLAVGELPTRLTITGKRLFQIDGDVWYPNVTTALGAPERAADTAPVASVWARRSGFGAARKPQGGAPGNRNELVLTSVHQWITDPTLHSVPEDTDRHVRAPIAQLVRELKSNLTEIWAHQELVVSHTLKAADRVDVIGVWNGAPAVVVFATSSSKLTAEEADRLCARGTALALCWFEATDELIENVVVLVGNETLFKPQVFSVTIYSYIKTVQQAFRTYHDPTK